MQKDKDTCTFHQVHEKIVNEVDRNLPDNHHFHELASFFKIFGDPTRIKIIYILFKSEMCVCDIAELLDVSQSAVSHQLKVLRDARIVKYRREGKTVFYSLDDHHIQSILSEGVNHISHR